MVVQDKIQELVEELIQGTELFLVDVRAASGSKSNKISVLLDSDEGISIDQCSKISRELGNKIEELSLLDSAYTLEVSSPGLDEPLKLDRQYRKNIGRELSVMLTDNSIIKGKLEEIKNDLIVLSVTDKKKKVTQVKEINLKEIKKSNVIVSFK